MSQNLCQFTLLRCNQGMAPMPMMVPPTNLTTAGRMPAATAMNHVPFLNIVPFITCGCAGNPAVAALQAIGIPRGPCIPFTPAPWLKFNARVKIRGQPVITKDSELMCMWGGKIKPMMPAQFTVKSKK